VATATSDTTAYATKTVTRFIWIIFPMLIYKFAGCDFNSWRMGDQTFLGPGLTVDTTIPFTFVTQFVTADNTTTGTLSEIRQIYVQNGNVIQNSQTNLAGISPPVNSITTF
jgi:hypothetical protein